MEKIKNIKTVVSTLPEKKRYAELLTAVLSIPVLITVLLLNISSLRAKPVVNTVSQQQSTTSALMESEKKIPTPTKKMEVATSINRVPTPTTITSPSPTISLSCTKEVGPIEITSPEESETIIQGPVCIDLTRKGVNYCEVAWSYRVNNDPWSEYMDKAICLYNLSPGQKTIEVRIKSIASSDQTILKRKFTVAGNFSPTPFASPAAQLQ